MSVSDTFTKVTSISWFGRIGGSIKNIVVGLFFVVFSIGALFWNEGRTVKTARALDEGAGIVRTIENNRIDPALEGKLVYFNGIITVKTQPVDLDFGISAPGMRLNRNVEMFQWVEHKKEEKRRKIGGGEETTTTYTYTREWSSTQNDSSRFHDSSGHQNKTFPVASNVFSVPEGFIGAFTLTPGQLSHFGTAQPLPLTTGQDAKAKELLGARGPITMVNGVIYSAKQPANPIIGDVRVSFAIVQPGIASLVAKQSGSGIDDYQTKNGRRLFLTSNGNVTAKELFATAKRNNRILAWALRAFFMLFLFFGLTAMMSIAGVIADVLPLAGSIVRFGTGIIGAALTLVIGTLTIAIAWLAYRPLVALGALVTGGVIAGVLVSLRAKNPKRPSQPVPAVKLG